MDGHMTMEGWEVAGSVRMVDVASVTKDPTDPLRFSVVSQRHRRRHVKQNVRMVTERAKRHFQLAAPDAHTSAQWVDTLEVWRERAAASVGRL